MPFNASGIPRAFIGAAGIVAGIVKNLDLFGARTKALLHDCLNNGGMGSCRIFRFPVPAHIRLDDDRIPRLDERFHTAQCSDHFAGDGCIVFSLGDRDRRNRRLERKRWMEADWQLS